MCQTCQSLLPAGPDLLPNGQGAVAYRTGQPPTASFASIFNLGSPCADIAALWALYEALR